MNSPIKGYRRLSDEDVALMNEAKELEQAALALVRKVKTNVFYAKNAANGDETERLRDAEPERWLAMARTDFQTATMKLCRAIAQPKSEDQ